MSFLHLQNLSFLYNVFVTLTGKMYVLVAMRKRVQVPKELMLTEIDLNNAVTSL